MKGIVKFFNDKKGYGFIGIEGRDNDLFVHFSAIDGPKSEFKKLEKDQTVEFEIEKTKDGQERASHVKVV